MSREKVFIATPAYAGLVHIDYLNALVTYGPAGLAFDLLTIGNESLITRARNTLLSSFYRNSECTHLLFLDGDVRLPAAGVKRLLGHAVDVVGAPVALKIRNELREQVFNVGRCLGEKGRLIEVTRVGTAALLLSRRAVDDLVAEARRDGRVYRKSNLIRGIDIPDEQFDVFQVGVVDNDYLSEDYWLCYRLRELGYSVYIDPLVVTRHQGITEF